MSAGEKAAASIFIVLALEPFFRRFELADHVNVNGAKLTGGPVDLKLRTVYCSATPRPRL